MRWYCLRWMGHKMCCTPFLISHDPNEVSLLKQTLFYYYDVVVVVVNATTAVFQFNAGLWRTDFSIRTKRSSNIAQFWYHESFHIPKRRDFIRDLISTINEMGLVSLHCRYSPFFSSIATYCDAPTSNNSDNRNKY